jgi:hypothetical protein
VTSDLARQQLAERGLLDPRQAAKHVRRGVHDLAGAPRTAFAAGVAQRLLRAHLASPWSGHDPELLAWEPTLDALWRGLAGDDSGADEVFRALARFYVRQQGGSQGALQGALQGEFLDAASSVHSAAAVTATYYTAQCYLHGCADFALWAARGATELAWQLAAEDEGWWIYKPASMRSQDWHAAHPAVQAEYARQLADLCLLGDRGYVLGDRRRDRLADRLRLLEALYRTDVDSAEQLDLFDGLSYFHLAAQIRDAIVGTTAPAEPSQS